MTSRSIVMALNDTISISININTGNRILENADNQEREDWHTEPQEQKKQESIHMAVVEWEWDAILSVVLSARYGVTSLNSLNKAGDKFRGSILPTLRKIWNVVRDQKQQ